MLSSEKYIMPRAKIQDYLLKPGCKHAQEFFAVGYTPNDVDQLNRDIEAQFDVSKATEFRQDGTGAYDFNIYMWLGVKKQKRFKTVWRKENLKTKPRFITAYRKDE